MSYLTRQAVRKEAGFQDVDTEPLSGVTDGSNLIFGAARIPIVDNNSDDEITTADVIVRANGVPVTVSEVEPLTGTITLVSAPPADTEMTITSATSALSDVDTDLLITEAEGIVNAGLRKFQTVPLSAEDVNFAVARRIAQLYAGGFALIRDYGKQTDTEESGKDGYAKVKLAKEMLEDLMSSIKDNGESSGSGGDAKTISEGHPLSRRHNRGDSRNHNYFMRKEC